MKEQPPYTVPQKDGWYWQPRGSIASVSKPQPLGKDRTEAFKEGWRLYLDAKASLKAPSDSARPFSISWAAQKWRESTDFRIKGSGKPKAAKTLKDQEDGLKLIEAEFGADDLRAMRRKHVKGWRKILDERKQPATTARALRTLRMLYSFLIDEDLYQGNNPASKMKIHVPEKNYTPWTPARVGQFIKQALNMGRPSLAIGLSMLYDTSQNPADVLAWQKGRFDGLDIELERGKTGQPGYVSLSYVTRRMMQLHPNNSVYLVAREGDGQPYTTRHFASLVRKVCAAAGLPDELKAGNLRHEAAQEAHGGGAKPSEIQNLLAHKSMGTQKFYTTPGRADGAQEARRRYRRKKRTKPEQTPENPQKF